MLTKVRPSPLPRADTPIALARTLGRAALAAAWAAHSPGVSERFLAPAPSKVLPCTWVRTADGWELPLWRRPPMPGADGAPVLLSVGPGLRPGCLQLGPGHSLVDALHREGFDVYLLSHRGDPDARAPAQASGFNFDDLVSQDLQATINAVRTRTCAQRVLFVGHGLGGLMFISHLARGGQPDLAAGVSLCAQVVFQGGTSRARDLHRVARLLPASWRIPHRAIQRWMLATGRDTALRPLAQQVDGPTLRRLALDGTADLSAALVQQIAKWHQAGHLCDSTDRFDDLAALQGVDFPLLSITGDADPVCPPQAASPLAHTLIGARELVLKGGWAHLDPIVGQSAHRDVFPSIVQWLARSRRKCWDRDM